MIEIFTSPTPNGIKIPITVEELGIPYRVNRIDLSAGEQRLPEFLAINPNGRIPAIIDHLATPGHPISVFESGAIMVHLADTYGGLIGKTLEERAATLAWLILQVAGLGPSFGNTGFFLRNDPDNNVAIKRFSDEAIRHLDLLETRLATTSWLNGEDYSIADIAHFCWVRSAGYAGLSVESDTHINGWLARIANRPGVTKALDEAAAT